MNILIPVDNTKFENAQITLLDDVKYWLLINHNLGKVIDFKFYTKKEDISDIIDIVVIQNDQEYVWPFIEENIAILVAPIQRYVEDIIEAYLFKELHDLNTNY